MPGEWMLHPDVVKQTWRVFDQAQVYLFTTQETAQCPLWYSLVHPAPLMLWYRRGRGFVCMPFPRSLCSRQFCAKVCRDEVSLLLVAPFWPGQVWFSELFSLLVDFSPTHPPRAMEVVGVAPEGAQLIASGLLTEVVETILQSRAPSMRKLYASKWKLFTSWHGDHQLDPVNCPLGTVLEFLLARLSAGLTHSTLKVYVAAISTYHTSLGGQSLGRNPLVTRFLCAEGPVWSRVHLGTWL